MKRKQWDDLGCLARDFTWLIEDSKSMMRNIRGLTKFVSKRMRRGQEFTMSQLAKCTAIKNIVDLAIRDADYWIDFVISEDAIQETSEYYAGLVLEAAEIWSQD